MEMRTRGSSRLDAQARKQLVLRLCQALASLNNTEEMAEALLDLLTPKEMETVAKRLEIADLLVQGRDYQSIRGEVRVGFSTIARVNTWLNLSGQGYKTMLSRKKPVKKELTDEERYDPFSWHNIKRRYSIYFWPERLLDELWKRADNREKKKIEKVLEGLRLKQREFRGKRNKELYQMFSRSF